MASDEGIFQLRYRTASDFRWQQSRRLKCLSSFAITSKSSSCAGAGHGAEMEGEVRM